ncbi:MAG TPA: helix-turn-helix transcriptional regulator [Gemmatimonadaceae bacterium]|jgi:transcriptional regulator with XRE-family HTH domain
MTAKEHRRKPETMGRRLAAARTLRGLSQAEAAEQAGFAQPYLSLLENDKAVSPPLNTVAKLARIYGVTIDYLVTGTAA